MSDCKSHIGVRYSVIIKTLLNSGEYDLEDTIYEQATSRFNESVCDALRSLLKLSKSVKIENQSVDAWFNKYDDCCFQIYGIDLKIDSDNYRAKSDIAIAANDHYKYLKLKHADRTHYRNERAFLSKLMDTTCTNKFKAFACSRFGTQVDANNCNDAEFKALVLEFIETERPNDSKS